MIAKTPIHSEQMGFEDWSCPKCNKELCSDRPDHSIKFCKNCGQPIDWDTAYYHERDGNGPVGSRRIQ